MNDGIPIIKKSREELLKLYPNEDYLSGVTSERQRIIAEVERLIDEHHNAAPNDRKFGGEILKDILTWLKEQPK